METSYVARLRTWLDRGRCDPVADPDPREEYVQLSAQDRAWSVVMMIFVAVMCLVFRFAP